jgi:hypothetical protein
MLKDRNILEAAIRPSKVISGNRPVPNDQRANASTSALDEDARVQGLRPKQDILDRIIPNRSQITAPCDQRVCHALSS